MERAFEETFTSTTFNVSRWLPSGSINAPAGVALNFAGKGATPWGLQAYGASQDQCAAAPPPDRRYPDARFLIAVSKLLPEQTPCLDKIILHPSSLCRPLPRSCPSAGSVGAASPVTCTLLDPSALYLNAPLPNYPGGASGAVLRLTQSLCVLPDGSNNPNCCQVSPIKNKVTGAITQSMVCAHWSGAHISSQGCVQFGAPAPARPPAARPPPSRPPAPQPPAPKPL